MSWWLWLFGLAGFEAEGRDALLRSELLVLSESHPGGSLTSLGTSAGGRDIPCVVLESTSSAGAERAVLLVGDALGEGERGAQLVLELAHTWIQAPVEGIDLYVVPHLDPDGDPFAQVRVCANFPAGWLPSTELPGAGPFPLHRPEALAMAEFLRGHPELVGLWSPGHLEDARGSLFAFAEESFGLVAARGDPGVSDDERAAAFLNWLSWLPSLRLTHADTREVGGGLWELDLELVNVGRLPCWLSAPVNDTSRPVELALDGAEILGAAAAGEGETLVPIDLSRDPEVVRLRHLGGGEWRRLRLVVRATAEPPSALSLRVRARRVGGDHLEIALGDAPVSDAPAPPGRTERSSP